MANAVSRYTGTNPNGESDIMSRLTVTDASYFKLADITAADSYTLRLWIKAAASRTVLCYIGNTLFSMAVTTAWKEIKHTADVSSGSTCELHLPAGTYYIWHPMLEKSTKASDWRQAPEDVANEIESGDQLSLTSAKAYVDGRLVDYSTSREVTSQIEQLQTSISLSIAEKVVETKNYATDQANTAKTEAINTANAATDTKLQRYVTSTQHSSDITLLSDRITANVTATTNLATYVDGTFYQQVTLEYTTLVTQTSQSIQSTVASTYATQNAVNGLDTRLTTAESTIVQQADQIALRVTKSGLVSEINQSSGTISMTANRFTISSTYFTLTANGTVTASKLTLTGGTIQSENYATTSGTVTAGTKINLTNGSISSKNFNVSSSGAVTMSNATLTGGTIKSSNYVAGSTGTSINLSTGAITSANFSISSTGVLTANGATLTGTIKSSSGDGKYFTRITAGELEVFYNSKRVAYMVPVFANDVCQLAILGSGNYDGVVIGAAFDSGIYTYYRCNIQDAATIEGCRHHFVGTVKFDDAIKSDISMSGAYLKLADHYGLMCNGSIALRYATTSDGMTRSGIYFGVDTKNLFFKGSTVATTGSFYVSDKLKFLHFANWTAKDAVWYDWDNGGLDVGTSSYKLWLNGSAIYANGSPVATTSDARLKTNVEPIDDRYIDMLDRMEPVKFCYTEGGSKRTHTGFIAQNVLDALTRAGLTTQEVAAFVDVNGDGEEYALRYEEFIAILLLKIRKLEDLIKNNRR